MKRELKNILAVTMLFGLTVACDRSDEFGTPPGVFVPVDNSAELNPPANFNWSASLKGGLTVIFNNPENISVDNELVQIVNNTGEIFGKALAESESVHFDVDLPQDQEYFVEFVSTGHRQKISDVGTLEMTVRREGSFYVDGKKASSSLQCVSCGTPFSNGNAELPIIPRTQVIVDQSTVPSWSTTASDGKIEIWRSGFGGVPSQEGNQFFEINANRSASLYQEVCITPGTTISWSIYHRGRAGVDVAEVLIGSSVAGAVSQATMTDGTTSWGYHTGTYTVPAGQTTTFFVFDAVTAAGGASIGNFIDNFQIVCDQDGDGVTDSNDDYPTDPTRAFKSYFPTAGKQIVAFEDLWPSLGDFDFNDMILATKGVISKNASGNLVDAQFTVAVDAIGAGLHNGIAMMLYDNNNTAFGSNVIASTSGDATLDPGNTNGLILSDNIFSTISEYYQNNGVGPDKVADSISFTITFNSGVATDFSPELYLFRTGDRSHEVHLSGFPTTATINPSLLNTKDDNGNFKTASGLPWGMEIITSGTWNHPLEKIDILDAYTQFQLWATSGGVSNPTWYTAPDPSKTFGN